VNPARRTQVIAGSAVALLVVAVAAFFVGLAVGDSGGGHHREFRVVCAPLGAPGVGNHRALLCERGRVCRPVHACVFDGQRIFPQRPGMPTATPNSVTPSPSPAPSTSSR
jgi:hypothetical protein